MTDKEQKKAAQAFVAKWQGHGYEKGETQSFWADLLHSVYGVENPPEYMTCEVQVIVDNETNFIDVYLPATRVMIEQKSINKDLSKPVRQSDGTLLTPLQQLKKYAMNIGYSKYPRWAITCNFREFHIYDMEQPNGEPSILKLEDLPNEYHRLNFLVDMGDDRIQKELEISLNAGNIVGRMYEILLKQYGENPTEEMLKSLNMLIVRLVFCLYAEDAGIFGRKDMFHDYLVGLAPSHFRRALIALFEVLDTPIEMRDPYMDKDLAEFPYVNGGLFADTKLLIPHFDEDSIDLLMNVACPFDWSGISPTIFGAVFESTLSAKIRRSGGMHYTSIENIHKVIDPLFLNDLQKEYEGIVEIAQPKLQRQKLEAFQEKLASLKFFDPACGSGNFLTETYISLRRLENKVISQLSKGQVVLGEVANPVKVSIHQFYGIEINDFACVVAKTAMWIAELQMMQETQSIVEMNLDFLPLKTYVNIIEGNALRLDWQLVLPASECSYIMGNPPFVGQSVRTAAQADDMTAIFGKGNPINKQDYVLCWYKKAISYINTAAGKYIKCAFVSTNSICQGEAVPAFWQEMCANNAEIIFAYTPFVWSSEAVEKAHVHCVIIGFSTVGSNVQKVIYTNGEERNASHINGYLYDAPDIWITARTNIQKHGLPKMTTGSPPTDDGGLLMSAEEKDILLAKYPILQKYIRPFIGAREFLHDKIGMYSRYCLWFKDGDNREFANIPEIRKRLQIVADLRTRSKADRIQKMAVYPWLFCQIRQPQNTYLVFPRHSSERRRYIPIGFVEPTVIAGDACSIIPNATVYQFGILTSNVHMAWMRIVAGRLEMRYRYSPAIYNNFPWCNPTEAQKVKIEKTAQGILTARNAHPDYTLAELYDELTMPADLRKAHQANDKAVMEAYGFWGRLNTESECVAELMKMYQQLTTK